MSAIEKPDLVRLLGPLLDVRERRRWRALTELGQGADRLLDRWPRFDSRFERALEPRDTPALVGTLRALGAPDTCTVIALQGPNFVARARLEPAVAAVLSETFECDGAHLTPGAAEALGAEVAAEAHGGENRRVALQRMDNVGIVVESLDAAISFFAELGLELEGRAMIEGDWSGRVTGLRDQRVEIAMMRTPDGHGRIELSRFLTPPVVADHRDAPVNALGYLRVMFAVDDLDDTLARLRRHGAQLVDEVVQYEDMYRLCYIRGPEGILIGLAEPIG